VELINIIGIVLGSSVFAALITSFFTRKSHEETIALKYITEERAKWREKIRESMIELNVAVNSPLLNGERTSKTRKASTYLKLSLNPDPEDKLDCEILKSIDEICMKPNYDKFSALEKKVSLLLKHDWERAKNEARAPISNLFLLALLIFVGWVVFYCVMLETPIYSFMQKIPYFSGSYSEVAFSAGFLSLTLWFAVFITKKVIECNTKLRIMSLLNPKMNLNNGLQQPARAEKRSLFRRMCNLSMWLYTR